MSFSFKTRLDVFLYSQKRRKSGKERLHDVFYGKKADSIEKILLHIIQFAAIQWQKYILVLSIESTSADLSV